jgi:heptaprenyl diphosphate synthase
MSLEWMKEMNSVNIHIQAVRNEVENKIKHSYLAKNLEAPIIDEHKLLLLVDFLGFLNFNSSQIVHYGSAVTIIQLALDTHEKVSYYEASSSTREKKQLTVLEGDLYSGLYYEALSYSSEINLIKTLSKAIRIMNEEKINFQIGDFKSVDQLNNCVMKIESVILSQFCNYFNETKWANYYELKLLEIRLQKELVHLQSGKNTHYIHNLSKLTLNEINSNLLQKDLENEITKTRKLLDEVTI